MKKIALFLLLTIALTACGGPQTTQSPLSPPASPTFIATPLPRTFDGDLAYAWVQHQCDLGPRIVGTEANHLAGDQIIAELRAQGWNVEEQTFDYLDTPIRNILAWRGEGPAVLIGAHYDSRPLADHDPVDPTQPVMGANDGASGVAVLLELARALDWAGIHRRVYLAFFDAEDKGYIDSWPFCVGSGYLAQAWGSGGEPPLEAAVIVDMIGDADQQIYYEQNSDPALSQQLWTIAGQLGYGERIIPQPRHTIFDDHVPFLQRGIPAVDMIDFDYPYWHTGEDTVDKVSPESLEAVGRTLEVWLEGTRE